MALIKPSVSKTKPEAEKAEEMSVQGVEATLEVLENPVEESPVSDEAAQEEKSIDPVQTTEVVTSVANPPAAIESPSTSMAQFKQTQAVSGFEGMELTSMSFDRIKLHEGTFKIGSEEEDLGTEFDAVIHATREIYVIRQSKDNDADSFYSYDPEGKTYADGTSSEDKLQEWLEDGYGDADSPLDIRPYLEATVVLTNRDDEYDEQMAMLSIPPASKARLAGAAAQAHMKHRGALLNQVVTRCQVGKKVGEGQKAFRPWLFKVVNRIDA